MLGPEFFDAENHPEVTFRSSSIELADDGTARLEGELTIAGVTRPVEIAGTWTEPIPAAGGGLRAGLELRRRSTAATSASTGRWSCRTATTRWPTR